MTDQERKDESRQQGPATQAPNHTLDSEFNPENRDTKRKEGDKDQSAAAEKLTGDAKISTVETTEEATSTQDEVAEADRKFPFRWLALAFMICLAIFLVVRMVTWVGGKMAGATTRPAATTTVKSPSPQEMKEVTELVKSVGGKVDLFHERIDAVEKRLDPIDERLDDIDRQVNDLNESAFPPAIEAPAAKPRQQITIQPPPPTNRPRQTPEPSEALPSAAPAPPVSCDGLPTSTERTRCKIWVERR